MENVSFQFNLPTEEILIGLFVSNGEAKNLSTGDITECLIISIGFLLFSIDIYIRSNHDHN